MNASTVIVALIFIYFFIGWSAPAKTFAFRAGAKPTAFDWSFLLYFFQAVDLEMVLAILKHYSMPPPKLDWWIACVILLIAYGALRTSIFLGFMVLGKRDLFCRVFLVLGNSDDTLPRLLKFSA